MLSDANISSGFDPRVRFHHPSQRLLVICFLLVSINHLWFFHILAKRLQKLILDFIRNIQSKVQIRRFLEFPFSDVPAFAVVLWSCNPGNTVIVVKVETLLSLLFGQVRVAVVVDKDSCGSYAISYIIRLASILQTSMRLVIRNSGLQTVDGRPDDPIQRFRVHGHLDRNPRRLETLRIGIRQVRSDCRIESRVLPEGHDWSRGLEDVGENNNGEEQAEENVQGNCQNQCDSDEGSVGHDLEDDI